LPEWFSAKNWTKIGPKHGAKACSFQEYKEHCRANPVLKNKLSNPENGLLDL